MLVRSSGQAASDRIRHIVQASAPPRRTLSLVSSAMLDPGVKARDTDRLGDPRQAPRHRTKSTRDRSRFMPPRSFSNRRNRRSRFRMRMHGTRAPDATRSGAATCRARYYLSRAIKTPSVQFENRKAPVRRLTRKWECAIVACVCIVDLSFRRRLSRASDQEGRVSCERQFCWPRSSHRGDGGNRSARARRRGF